MSSPNNLQMTEEQKIFLTSLEEEFKHRYTENDEEFRAVLNEKSTVPPVVENWVNFRHRDDRRDYRDHRDDRRDYRDYRDDRRDYRDYRDDRRDYRDYRDDRRDYRDHRDRERFRDTRRYDGGGKYPHSSK